MATKTKKVAGLDFKKQLTTTRGRDAERYARELREDGFLAKVVEENIGGSTLYIVYSHKVERTGTKVASKTLRITPKTPRLRR